MKSSLCPISCALVALVSSSVYGQDDTGALQYLIDNVDENPQTTPLREVTIQASPDGTGRPWTIGPVQLKSDLQLTFAAGAVIEAKAGAFDYFEPCEEDPTQTCCPNPGTFNTSLFWAQSAENLVIIGNGATLRMQGVIDVHPGGEYPRCSEWVHGLSLKDSSNVEVSELTIEDTGGDGIYIDGGTRIAG